MVGISKRAWLYVLVALACAGPAGVGSARAQAGGGSGGGEAGRLTAAFPDLFPAAVLTDTFAGGQGGALLAATTEAQTRLGFQQGDIVLAVEGRPIASLEGAPGGAGGTGSAHVTFTVWRAVAGDRPVLEPAVVGRQVIDRFVAVPEAERTPMRLARMLANQRTLVVEGAGAILLPASAGDAEWLRVANPMPTASEAALREISDALRPAGAQPARFDAESQAARRAFEGRHYLEAESRAQGAMALYVLEPANRKTRKPLDDLVTVYASAIRDAERRRQELMVPDARFGLVLEGQLSGVQHFLPQNTLAIVEDSRGSAFNMGLRLRPFIDRWLGAGPESFVYGFSFLAEYGQIRNSFKDHAGKEIISILLQPVSLEAVFRPRIAVRLKPFLRGGVAIYPMSASVNCSGDSILPDGKQTAISGTGIGWLAGGGLDFFYMKSTGLHASVSGTYRVISYQFLPDAAPSWTCAENALVGNPTFELDHDIIKLDLNAWQVGLMLSLDL